MAKDGVNIFNAPMAHEVSNGELYSDDVLNNSKINKMVFVIEEVVE